MPSEFSHISHMPPLRFTVMQHSTSPVPSQSSSIPFPQTSVAPG